MNQELKLQNLGRSRVQDFVMINYPQIYCEFLKTNNASHSLFVGEDRFCTDQNILEENIRWSYVCIWYIRFIRILRTISYSQKKNSRSDTNLGREEYVLKLDQSSRKVSLVKGLTLKKHKLKKRGYKNGKRRNKTSKSRN